MKSIDPNWRPRVEPMGFYADRERTKLLGTVGRYADEQHCPKCGSLLTCERISQPAIPPHLVAPMIPSWSCRCGFEGMDGP